MGMPDHLTCLLRNLYAVRKQQLELDMEQQTGSKWGKESVKAVYCHPECLIYMQSTSCRMLGWKKHKLESRLPGEISIASDMQMSREGTGGPLQYPCLENPRNGGAQWAAIYEVAQSQTRLTRLSSSSSMQMSPPLWKKVKRNYKAS